MNESKDIKKTEINSYGQSNISIFDKHIYDVLNKKTEKLVTALYMVIECMDSHVVLKERLHVLGVELVSEMYRFSTISLSEKNSSIHTLSVRIAEIISFTTIASDMGFISQMNTTILKREFISLSEQIVSLKMKAENLSFTLDQTMFETESTSAIRSPFEDLSTKKNILIRDKNTPIMSVTSNHTDTRLPPFKIQIKNKENNMNKDQRSEKIISLIKDKKGTIEGRNGLSIKDISNAFDDCSEKTIQRELNSLVVLGKIKKTGAKRWSKYLLI